MTFARLVLRLSALPFAASGLGFLLFPAALLLWGAARPERAHFALVAQALLYGGLAGCAAGWLALRRTAREGAE